MPALTLTLDSLDRFQPVFAAVSCHSSSCCFLFFMMLYWSLRQEFVLVASLLSPQHLVHWGLTVFQHVSVEQDLPHVAVQPHASEKRRLRNPDVLRRGKSFRPLTSGLTIEEGNKGRTLITVPESNQNLFAGIQHVTKHQVICDNLIYNTDLLTTSCSCTGNVKNLQLFWYKSFFPDVRKQVKI